MPPVGASLRWRTRARQAIVMIQWCDICSPSVGAVRLTDGDAVGALDKVLSDVRRQQLIAYDAVDHGADLAMSRPIEGRRCYVRLSDPGCVELWPRRHDQENAKARDPVHHATERFQARGIAPLRIL